MQHHQELIASLPYTSRVGPGLNPLIKLSTPSFILLIWLVVNAQRKPNLIVLYSSEKLSSLTSHSPSWSKSFLLWAPKREITFHIDNQDWQTSSEIPSVETARQWWLPISGLRVAILRRQIPHLSLPRVWWRSPTRPLSTSWWTQPCRLNDMKKKSEIWSKSLPCMILSQIEEGLTTHRITSSSKQRSPNLQMNSFLERKRTSVKLTHSGKYVRWWDA